MIKLTPSQLQEEVLTAANLDENQQQSLLAEINMMSTIYAFALPGHSDELTVSCSFLMHVSSSTLQGSWADTDRAYKDHALLRARVWIIPICRL